jgi:tRNA pseudouridine38-40 synthase
MGGAGAYLRATVAYDGTEFAGFQVQVAQRTVQGELEAALAKITQSPVRVIGAGRTDSGVHARGQVVAFRTQWRRSVPELQRAWNAVLPKDVAVWNLQKADESFHPRFSARSRTYRYTVWNHPIRDPLLRRTALWYPRLLDLATMNEAALLLVGEHDFATFGSSSQGTNTIRRVVLAEWTRKHPSSTGHKYPSSTGHKEETLCFDIEANAFLNRMARSIVGTLLQVGTGELSVREFGERFAAAERSRSRATAPAHGLCLMAVKY